MAGGVDHCLLKEKLSLLRKSSKYSIDYVDSFEEEKAYMHVYRGIEDDLKNIIKSVNENQKKALIFVTGSAGDGKSHLLSYLKSQDPDGILAGYHLINDATESDKPSRTAVETLAERLKDYSDENLDNGETDKTIVAVNLGMLNNFVESPYSDGFKQLRKYVIDNKLITNPGNTEGYKEHCVFQNISFSDYQFFALTKENYDDSYLLKVFQKVTGKDEQNPFYRGFTNCENCSRKKGCPIRENYLFFSELAVQKAVAYRVIEAIVRDKVIVTMRRLLDFIYGILVGPDEELSKIWNSKGVAIQKLQTYLRMTLPFLLNKTNNMNPLSIAVEKNGILASRTKDLDSQLIRLFSTSDFGSNVEMIEEKTPYNLLYFVEKSVLESLQEKSDRDLKTNLILFDLYLQNCETIQIDSELKQYLQYLFAYATGDSRSLRNLLKLASNTVERWNGTGGTKNDEEICFDNSLRDYWLFETCTINIDCCLSESLVEESPIYRFSPTIYLEQKDSGYKIDVDFSLFALMKRMENGNRPTQEERDLFIDFSRFIQKIIDSGNLKRKIIFIRKDVDNHTGRYIFKKEKYGEYEFRG